MLHNIDISVLVLNNRSIVDGKTIKVMKPYIYKDVSSLSTSIVELSTSIVEFNEDSGITSQFIFLFSTVFYFKTLFSAYLIQICNIVHNILCSLLSVYCYGNRIWFHFLLVYGATNDTTRSTILPSLRNSKMLLLNLQVVALH